MYYNQALQWNTNALRNSFSLTHRGKKLRKNKR